MHLACMTWLYWTKENRKVRYWRWPPPNQRWKKRLPQQRTRESRNRQSGGADAALRHGFEVTFDLRTIELLDAATDNRSEYLETLALGCLVPQAGEEHLAVKLEARCNAFPAMVAKKLRKIWTTLGVRAAWEASE